MNRRAAMVVGALLLAIASAAAQPRTVLDGAYTAAQAERGGALYGARCAACHEGADADGPPLTGAPFIDRWREDSLGSLFEFVKTEMPQTAPGSLSDANSLDIVAHLLHENDFPTGPRELTVDLVGSTLLVGPDGPQPLPPGALVRIVGCLTQSAAREWVLARATRPARVTVGTEITAGEAAAAAGAAPGTDTFTLQNIGEWGTALPAEGRRVVVKGALYQRAGAGRIRVTAATHVAGDCE